MGAKRIEKESYKVSAVKAAEDLGYGDDVIRKIKYAKTDGEIERITITARHDHFKD